MIIRFGYLYLRFQACMIISIIYAWRWTSVRACVVDEAHQEQKKEMDEGFFVHV